MKKTLLITVLLLAGFAAAKPATKMFDDEGNQTTIVDYVAANGSTNGGLSEAQIIDLIEENSGTNGTPADYDEISALAENSVQIGSNDEFSVSITNSDSDVIGTLSLEDGDLFFGDTSGNANVELKGATITIDGSIIAPNQSFDQPESLLTLGMANSIYATNTTPDSAQVASNTAAIANIETNAISAEEWAGVSSAAFGRSDTNTAQTARTILLAGQSNAANPSVGDLTGLASDQITGVPNTYLYNYDWYHSDVDYIGPLRAYDTVTNAWSAELVFGRAIERITGQTVYVIKYAYGGSTLDEWLPDAGVVSTNEEINLYGKLTNAVAAAQTEWPEMPPISGFVWAQGESDAVSEAGVAMYVAGGLDTLYDALKTDVFGGKDVPTIISGLGPKYFTLYGSRTEELIWGPVVTQAHADFCAAHPQAVYVRANDIDVAEEPDDGSPWVHYTAAGKIKWGERIASTLLNLWEDENRSIYAEAIDVTGDVAIYDGPSLTNIDARVETLESRGSGFVSSAGLQMYYPFWDETGSGDLACNWWRGVYDATNVGMDWAFDSVAQLGFVSSDSDSDTIKTLSPIDAGITTNNLTWFIRYRPTAAINNSSFRTLFQQFAAIDAAYNYGFVLYGVHADAVTFAHPSFRLAGSLGQSNGVDLDFVNSVTINEWSSLGGTVDRSTGLVSLYFDGELDTTYDAGTNLTSTLGLYFVNSTTHLFGIGGRPDNASFGSQGDVSDFALFYRDLDATEMALLHSGVPINKTGWRPE